MVRHQDFRFPELSLARLRFRLQARAACVLPCYLGSTLRGSLGHSLKAVSCSVAHGMCEACWLESQCSFPFIFQGTAAQSLRTQRDTPPHPYIVRPPSIFKADTESDNTSVDDTRGFAARDELSFEIVLLGEAASRVPYIALAVRDMAKRGLGVDRAAFELVEAELIMPDDSRVLMVRGDAAPDFAVPHLTLNDYLHARLAMFDASDVLRLRLLTPTRIQVEKKLQTALDFELLTRNILRRLHLLFNAYSPQPFAADYRPLIDAAREVVTTRSAMRWHELERYSNRQEAKLKLSGIIGEVEYAGAELPAFAPFLCAGELLHIGASCVMGLGRYELAM